MLPGVRHMLFHRRVESQSCVLSAGSSTLCCVLRVGSTLCLRIGVFLSVCKRVGLSRDPQGHNQYCERVAAV